MSLLFGIVSIVLSLAVIFYIETWLDNASQTQHQKAQKFQGKN